MIRGGVTLEVERPTFFCQLGLKMPGCTIFWNDLQSDRQNGIPVLAGGSSPLGSFSSMDYDCRRGSGRRINPL